MRLSVLFVSNDDHTINLARGLMQAYGQGLDVVACTASDIARGAQIGSRPDVLFMESSEFRTVSGPDGALARIRFRWPKACLLALGNGRLQDILTTARAGAAGYIHHAASADEITDVIRRAVADDEFILPTSILTAFDASVVPSPLYAQASHSSSALSPRERSVVLLLASGMSNLELSEFLHVSENTAKWHANNALRKLGLHNRSQLAAWFRGRIRPVVADSVSSATGSSC